MMRNLVLLVAEECARIADLTGRIFHKGDEIRKLKGRYTLQAPKERTDA